jgi:hypothetical protein
MKINFLVMFLATLGGLGYSGQAWSNIDDLRTIEWVDKPSLVAKDYHRMYRNKIEKNWNPPSTAKGAYVKVRFFLTNEGYVNSLRVQTINSELSRSMHRAISLSTPFALPVSKESKRMSRKFEHTFFVK